MAHAAVASDFHQPFDVHRDLFAQIAFDAALFLDHAADLPHIVLGEILHADVGAYAGILEDVVRADASDPVDVGQPYLDTLRSREVDACYSSHVSPWSLVLGR